MMRSMYSAVSGLKTHQTRMDVIGNNIANVNTEAFKSSSVTFSEIMYQTISSASAGNGATGRGGVNAKQIGLGVSTGSTSVSIETAGAAETTGNPFDLKLTDSQTTNFFIVSDGTNTMFTRAGSFYVDGNGFLCMSSTGYTLMGWQVDPSSGEIRKDTVSALQVMSPGNQTSQPEATNKAYVSGVLDKNDVNLVNEEGYVLNLNFYDNLGYGYTGRFMVKPAYNEDGSIKNPGEYTIALTDILDQNGTSVIKDPSDPTGETYLPNLEPGRFFSTGEVRPKDVTTAQSAYDSLGNKYPIYNLGSSSNPKLFTLDSFGNFYRVEEDGVSFVTELNDEYLAYKLVKDKAGKVYYADPGLIQGDDISPTASNLAKDPNTNVAYMADKDVLYQFPGNADYYKISEDGNTLYKAAFSSFAQEYVVTTEPTAKKHAINGTGGGDVYVIGDPIPAARLNLNTEDVTGADIVDSAASPVTASDYNFFKKGANEYYAVDKATGNMYKVTKTEGTPATYSVDTSTSVALPAGITATSTPDATVGGYYIFEDGGAYYAIATADFDSGTLTTVYSATSVAAVNDKYEIDDTTAAYVSVKVDGEAGAYYVEPENIISGTATATAERAGGVEVYELPKNSGEWFVKKGNDLYKVSDKTNLDDLKSDATPYYIAYKDGQNATVYIKREDESSLAPDTDPNFADVKSKPYTITKTIQEYTPYTLVFDQNNGKFVSCGVDNQTPGNSLMLNMADVVINRVVTDPDGEKNIYTSEDGYTTSHFKNIEIDFTKSMNYNNSGTSTLKALKGDIKGDGTGKKLGALTGLTVDNSGKVYGSYDNGNTVLLCQIACAQFSNASGLEKVGENCYQTTLNSGEFDGIGVEVDADGSSISTGELEMSNVDLSSEFTSMIVTQRGFQANSRVITTSDTLLEELINLKR